MSDRKSWRHWLQEWIISHASWDILLGCFRTHLHQFGIALLVGAVSTFFGWLVHLPPALLFVLGFGVFGVVLVAWGKLASRSVVFPTEIRFDYLPDSPLNNGWKLAYQDPGAVPLFTSPLETPGLGGLSVNVDRKYALDYEIPPYAILCDRLEFAAKFTETTMFFTRVEIASRDTSKRENWWIKYYIGSNRPAEQTDGTDKEHTVWVSPRPLENGWMAFEITLPETVRKIHWWTGMGLLFAYDN